MTKEDLLMRIVWQSIMEHTAHCGWTLRARESLVEHTQENVKWALSEAGDEYLKRFNEAQVPNG